MIAINLNSMRVCFAKGLTTKQKYSIFKDVYWNNRILVRTVSFPDFPLKSNKSLYPIPDEIKLKSERNYNPT
jgi:hypothetical protein